MSARAFKPNKKRMQLLKAIHVLTDQDLDKLKRKLTAQVDQNILNVQTRSELLLVLEQNGVLSIGNVASLMDILEDVVDKKKKQEIMEIIQPLKDQSQDVKKKKEDPSRTFAPSERHPQPSTDQSKVVIKKKEDHSRTYASPEKYPQPVCDRTANP